MARSSLGLGLAIVDVAGSALLTVAGLLALGPAYADLLSALMFLSAVAAFAVMGAVLLRRAPANAIGAMLLATATVQTVGIAVLTYAAAGLTAVPAWPGAAFVASFGDVAYTAPFVIALIGVPLLFPDGHLPSPRFRWVAATTVTGLAAMALAALASTTPGLEPLGVSSSPLVGLAVVALVIGFVGSGVAIWTRFRRGGTVQRQQVKWLLIAAGFAVASFPPAMLLGSGDSILAYACWAVAFLSYLALPVAIGIAVLRYRLYDIDRIISRTVGYAVVTVVLTAVLAGAVLVLQELAAPLTTGNSVAVVVSTLVVAALFQPLLLRVQHVVDRRFDRARYDAELTVAAFAAQLRDEVDLGSLTADVRRVVDQTIAPVSIGIWIRQPDAES